MAVGKLVVRNKSLGGGRTTGLTKLSRRPRPTIYKPNFRSVNEEQRILEVKYEVSVCVCICVYVCACMSLLEYTQIV